MKFETVKSPKDVKLSGVSFEFDVTDKALNAVTLRDGEGNIVRIGRGRYSEIQVEVPAAPEKVKKSELSYSLPLIGEKKERFDEKYQATSRQSELTAEYPDIKTSIEEVEEEIPF